MYEEIKSKNLDSKTRVEKYDCIERSVNFMLIIYLFPKLIKKK